MKLSRCHSLASVIPWKLLLSDKLYLRFWDKGWNIYTSVDLLEKKCNVSSNCYLKFIFSLIIFFGIYNKRVIYHFKDCLFFWMIKHQYIWLIIWQDRSITNQLHIDNYDLIMRIINNKEWYWVLKDKTAKAT